MLIMDISEDNIVYVKEHHTKSRIAYVELFKSILLLEMISSIKESYL